MIHLEGMGVIGAHIAWELHRQKVPFTWHDTESSHVAWRACTGAIFPTGEYMDQQGMEGWHRWLAGEAAWASMPSFRGCVEQASWWYSTKAPAHGAPGKATADLGSLRRLETDSLHFNAQKFVPLTREFFKPQRRDSHQGGRLVVTHGFGERNHHVVWGWTRLVTLDLDARLRVAGRPSIYCREGRFVMAYAYPVAGTPFWYAGSSLIVQKGKPKSLEIEPKFQTWAKHFHRLTGGLAKVTGVSDFIEGWRPAPAKTDTGLVTQRADGALLVKPCWHNGVRLSPLIVREVMLTLLARPGDLQ